MTKKMLIDASHPEETRVVVVNGTRVEELDFESSNKRQLRGNVYLARVTRVEPSLQAAFVEFGGNRHGFLAFSEIHPDYYQIPYEDRMALLEAEEAEAREDEKEEDDEEDAAPKGKRGRSRGGKGRGRGRGKDAKAAKSKKPAKVSKPVEDEDEDEDAVDPTKPASRSYAVASKLVFSNFDDEIDPTSVAADNFKHADSLKVIDFDPDLVPDDPDEDEDDNSEDASSRDENDSDADDIKADASDEDDAEVAEEQANMDKKRRKRVSRRRYKIQEVIKRGQIMLVQAVKEERGNKGAALTTYMSLAGRYCVLMPNTPRGGGISRKIANGSDRKRLKTIMSGLEVPQGMGVIVRTAGAKRTQEDIQRDYDYLARLWETIRDTTMESVAPALIHQEGDLVKRSIRDLYNKDIEEILVAGEKSYDEAKNFIDMLMPSHVDKVKLWDNDVPLFLAYQVNQQIEASLEPVAQLKSGGYLVIHPTEALVSVDVNSGRSTKERNVERTALKTNLEAAEEVARQMRLRDLAGLVVIDFIDMDESRNNRAVEKKMKEVLSRDRARVQMGRISQFGLMEISRQRRRRSLLEGSSASCEHCSGVGRKRSVESSALKAIRAVEEEGIRGKAKRVKLRVSPNVALYLFNEKRDLLSHVDSRFNMFTELVSDDTLHRPSYELERTELRENPGPDPLEKIQKENKNKASRSKPRKNKSEKSEHGEDENENTAPSGRSRRRRRGGRKNKNQNASENAESQDANLDSSEEQQEGAAEQSQNDNGEQAQTKKRRRRGRRGGRNKRGGSNENRAESESNASDQPNEGDDQKPASDEAKPKRRRRKSQAAKDADAPKLETEATESEATETDSADDKPKRKPRRKAAPKGKAKPADAGSEETAEKPSEEKPKRTRKKAPTKKAAPKKTAAKKTMAKSEDDAPKAPKAKAPKVKAKTTTKAKAKAKPESADSESAAQEKPKRTRRRAPAPTRSTEKAPAKPAKAKPVETVKAEAASDAKPKAKKETAKKGSDKSEKKGWWAKRNPFA